MSRIQKSYLLPTDLVDDIDRGNVLNRSRVFDLAVTQARRDPERLVQALRRRLATDKSLTAATSTTSMPSPLWAPLEIPTRRVVVSVDPRFQDDLRAVAVMTGLPQEHVLRLALEAYIAEGKVTTALLPGDFDRTVTIHF